MNARQRFRFLFERVNVVTRWSHAPYCARVVAGGHNVIRWSMINDAFGQAKFPHVNAAHLRSTKEAHPHLSAKYASMQSSLHNLSSKLAAVSTNNDINLSDYHL